MSGSLSEIKEKHKRDSLLIEFSTLKDLQSFWASEQMEPLLKDTEQEGLSLMVHTQNYSQVGYIAITVLDENHIIPTRFEVLEPTLENLYVEVVQ